MYCRKPFDSFPTPLCILVIKKAPLNRPCALRPVRHQMVRDPRPGIVIKCEFTSVWLISSHQLRPSVKSLSCPLIPVWMLKSPFATKYIHLLGYGWNMSPLLTVHFSKYTLNGRLDATQPESSLFINANVCGWPWMNPVGNYLWCFSIILEVKFTIEISFFSSLCS